MSPAEAAVVLARAAVYDRRTVGELEAHAWAKALSGLALDDCVAAVDAHYAAKTDWLMPAHVRAGVGKIRAHRLAIAEDPPPDADPDNPAAYLAALRAGRVRIADAAELKARPVQAAIEAAMPRKPPAGDYSEAPLRARRYLIEQAREAARQKSEAS